MIISFHCPGCGKSFRKTNTLGGRPAVCRGCRCQFVIPDPAGADHPFPPAQLNFACPGCGKVYRKDNTLAGHEARCLGCQSVFRVPDDEEDDVPYVAPAAAARARPAAVATAAPPPAPAAAAASAPSRQRPPAPDDDDLPDLPIVFEPDDEDDRRAGVLVPGPDADPYTLPADDGLDEFRVINTSDAPNYDPRPVAADAGPKPGPRPGKARPAPDRPDRAEQLAQFLDRISALPWVARRLIIVGIAVVGLVVFGAVGQMFRGGASGVFSFMSGNALDPDDEPDPELDERPPVVARPEVVAGHEKALEALAGACEAMTAAIRSVGDAAAFAAAAPKISEAALRIEQAGKQGERLTKPNRAEIARLQGGAAERFRTAVGGLVMALSDKERIPGLGEPLGKMRKACEEMNRRLGNEYAVGPGDMPQAELKVTGVAGRDAADVITARFDEAVPKTNRTQVSIRTDGNARVMRIRFGPIEDPKEVVDRLTFGKVERVHGRRIRLAANPLTDADLAAARTAREDRERRAAGAARPAPQPKREPAAPAPEPTPAPAPAVASQPEPEPEPKRVPGAPAPVAEPEPKRVPGAPAPAAAGPIGETVKGWYVLFRGRDPKAWNTDTRDGPTRAVPVASAPAGVKYLRLTRLDTGEALIVPVEPDELARHVASGRDPNRPVRWCGTNEEAWGAHHMGIAEGKIVSGFDAKAHGPVMVQAEGIDAFPGSGFGHEGHGDGRSQHFGWHGKKIEPTDFEIAVSPGPLTPAEQGHMARDTQ